MENDYVLSKKEIGDAITHYIGMSQKTSFFPFHISATKENIVLPEEVSFRLKMVPKGAKIGEFPHKI